MAKQRPITSHIMRTPSDRHRCVYLPHNHNTQYYTSAYYFIYEYHFASTSEVIIQAVAYIVMCVYEKTLLQYSN